jgi:hypothetical protein
MLKENKKIHGSSSWTKTKLDLETDPRYQTTALSSNEKEDLFRKYVDKLGEQEKRKQREEAIKRQREKEVQRMREKEDNYRHHALSKQKQEEEMIDFQTLLKERIRDPEASWSKSRATLEADYRYQTDYLTTEQKEKAFRDHLRNLLADQITNYKNLLRESYQKGHITLATKKFDDIREYICDDPRYEKLYSDDRRFIFTAFLKELKEEAFESFREFLKESKNTGILTSKSATAGPKFETLKELLHTDRRYKTLDPCEEERDEEIIRFIKNLGAK